MSETRRIARWTVLAAIVAVAFLLLNALQSTHRSSESPQRGGAESNGDIDAEATARRDSYVDRNGDRRKFVPDQILVQFREATDEAQASRIVADLGATVAKKLGPSGLLLVLHLPAGMTPEEALQRVSELAEVAAAEPNYVYYKDVIPNEPQFGQLWGLNNTVLDVDINAPEAWDISTGDANVYIGVIDSGFDYSHDDLSGNVWTNPGEIAANGIDDDQNGWIDDIHGYDVVNGDPDPDDDDGHGTHVSGTIAATGNNGIGYVGVMWRASLIACKFLDREGYGTTAGAIECLDYFSALRDSGIAVVATNNSWGGSANSTLLRNAIAAHRSKGILFVAAAGNDGVDTDKSPHYPSSYNLDNVISVAAIDSTGQLASFSNYGRNSVDIAAPGVGIWSLLDNNNYGLADGTSMAAPHVSGVVGLIKATDPMLAGAEIRSWLLEKATRTNTLSGKVDTGGFLRATLPPTDQDADGMPDRWELQYGLNPQNPADAASDNDGDGLSNLGEFLNGTSPLDPDSDDDGLSDGVEVNTYFTDPTLADTDGDGIDDGAEINQTGTNPNATDTDGDGLSDGDELNTYGTNPTIADSDGDGLADGWEVAYGLNPLQGGEQLQDSDGDGLDNAGEFLAGTNPLIIDSDGDGLNDGDEVNVHGTDPTLADTDSDRMSDEWEVRFGLNPLDDGDASLDPDGDGFSNLEEFLGGTDPTSALAVPPYRPWSNRNGSSRQTAHAPIATPPDKFKLAWQLAVDFYQTREIAITDGNVVIYKSAPPYGKEAWGIDLITGKQAWSRTLPQAQSILGLRALDDDIVIVGESYQSIAASLWLLDTRTGTPTKTIPVGEYRPRLTVITTDRSSLFAIADADDELLHVDTAGGEVVWRTPLVTTAQQRIYTPLAANESYVAAAAEGRAFVFDRLTGELLIDIAPSVCPSVQESAVMIDSANRVFVTGSKCTWALDIASQQVLWENDASYGDARPSMDADAIYVEKNGRLRALDKATGATLWEWLDGFFRGDNIVSSATHVFIEASPGLTAINKSTHLAEWQHPLRGFLAISDEGILIVESDDHDGFSAINISGDTDGDGIPDSWEQRYKLDQLDPNDAALDPDNDGLSNLDEYNAGTDPRRHDSDNDGLDDFDEIWVTKTDPSNSDSDGDGLSDGDEVNVYGSHPQFADSDQDGMLDGDEVNGYGTDPADRSSIPPLIYAYDESFESGMPDGWSTPAYAQAGWMVRSDTASDGSFSLTTGNSPRNVIAIIEWSGEFAAGDLIYDAKIDAPGGTSIEVYLDGKQVEYYGNTDWERKGIRIPQGLHKIAFHFRPNSLSSRTASIDNLRFRVPAPFASNTNHVVALAQKKIWELDLAGNAVRLPIPVPNLNRETDITVGINHKTVVAAAPFLYFYDPVAGKFTKKFVGQWYSGSMAAYDDGIILHNVRGLAGNFIRLDADGNYVSETAQIPDLYYGDIHVGLDGYLYGLRGYGGEGFLDQMDIATLSVIRTVPVDSLARQVAVDSAGQFFVNGWRERYLKYSADGTLLDQTEENTGGWLYGPDIASNGTLVFGGTRGEIAISNTDLDPLQRFPINVPSARDINTTFRVAAIRTQGEDADTDGLPDWWEYAEHYDPLDASDALLDVDGDGLNTLGEFLNQTDPNIADTDGDGLSDGIEVGVHGSNPLRTDSDGDLIPDLDEVSTYFTNPASRDTDADGLSDWDELFATGTDPVSADSDGDGMTDGWEVSNGLDALSAADAGIDADADGLSNVEEFTHGTDILDADTDNDELTDGEEINTYRTFPLIDDSDADWLHDGWEVFFAFDPLLAGEQEFDQDADGYTSLDEFYSNTDPTDAASRPATQPWSMHQGDAAHTGYMPIRLDPRRYEEIWRNQALANMRDRGPLTVRNGVASLTVNDESQAKYLYALDAINGTVRWSRNFAITDSLSSPTADADALFVQSANFDVGAMHKLDLATGDIIFETPYELERALLLAPTLFGDRLYAYNDPASGIASFRTDSPVIEWTTPVFVGWRFATAVDNAQIYALAREGLTVLDRQTGNVLYVITSPDSIYNYSGNLSTVVDRFGYVYVVANGNLVTFDTPSRSVAWQIDTGGFEGYPSFASGVIYAVDTGAVVAIDSRNGAEIWRWSDASPVQSSVVVTLDYLFVSTYFETIALDRKTGQRAWSTATGGELSVDQAGNLYVSGYSGDVVAFGLSIDRDGDGMPDAWEDFYGLDADDPSDATLDPDGDNLSNIEEFRAYTNPLSADTDGDTLSDDAELGVHGTDPNLIDSDADGLDDNVEILVSLTDPNDPDSDDDRSSDGDEVNLHSTNPLLTDSDGDGVSDFNEIQSGSDPLDSASTPAVLAASVESFESGALPLGWSVPVGSEYGWSVTAGEAYDGSFRLESDPLNGPGPAVIEFTGNLPAGYVQFYVTANPDGCCGEVASYVNGNLVTRDSRNYWEFSGMNTVAGIQTLRWEFSRTALVPQSSRSGILDRVEIIPDRDYDGMPDAWEESYGLNPDERDDAHRDTDNDGLDNRSEFWAGTSPVNPDSDADGMNDGFEDDYNLDPLDPSDASGDADGDGLDNATEASLGTSPLRSDSDADGMPDAFEVNMGLDPTDSRDRNGDLDGDQMTNVQEYTAGTSLTNPDSDSDTLPDGWEYQQGLDPLDPTDADGDLDGDGLDNKAEFGLGTKPNNPDSDNDQLPDGWEITHGFDPIGSAETHADPDADGLSNINEYNAGTLPRDPDTDQDGMPDGWEAGYGLDPLSNVDASGDADGDTLDNVTEFSLGTSPLSADSDNDGMPDDWEVANNLDPTANDAGADPDGDGISNINEFRAGSDPHVAAPRPPPQNPPPPKKSGGGGSPGPIMLFALLLLLAARRERLNRRR